MIRLSAKALALLGIWNWFLINFAFGASYSQIGKFLDDEEEEDQQCAYFWELDQPISLASCKPEFAKCYQSGYDDAFLCEGCSVVGNGNNKYFTEITDADCTCTCCWFQYLQNYCFKRLCSDNDEFVRLYEYTKSICDRTPARKNVRPYRPKNSKSFGNPSDKIDIDADDEIDDYYVEVGAESVENIQLFASDNNRIYRSLIDAEKDFLFDKLSNVFDPETLTVDEDFTDHSQGHDDEGVGAGTHDIENFEEEDYADEFELIDLEDDSQGVLEKRSPSEKEVNKAADALRLYKEDFSFEFLQDLFSIYVDKADDFFTIFKQFLGEEKFKIFHNSFQEARERVTIHNHETLTFPASKKLCLDIPTLLGKPLPITETEVNLQVTGCALSALVESVNSGYCSTTIHCSCQCSLGIGIKKCIERYATAEELKPFLDDTDFELISSCNGSAAREAFDAESIVLNAEAHRLQKLVAEEKLGYQFNFLKHLKSVASTLNFSDELEEFRTDLVYKSSVERPISDTLDSVNSQVIVDKCELINSDLKKYMKFNLDSCDIRDLYYCKNHYKGNKCLKFEKDTNDCNNACCLEIKMAECAKSHCLSKKPVKEFEKIANLICTVYADKHVTEGLPPFPDADKDEETNGVPPDSCDGEDCEETPNIKEAEDVKDESTSEPGDDGLNGSGADENSLEKRVFGDSEKYDDDVLNNVGESVCELEEFEPGYDLNKCDKKEVKDCIKEGVQFLLDDAENFCPYCVNDNAYDECRCACCLGRYFSKVCYDPHCVILTEKLRYKRYVREICKTRPVKYLFARSTKQSSLLKELPVPEKSNVVSKNLVIEEYKDLDQKRAILKNHTINKHPVTSVAESKQSTGEFDLFSGFEATDGVPQESKVYFESHPVNIHKENLDKKRKSKLRYNFKLQAYNAKRDIEYASDNYEDADDDETHVLYVEKGLAAPELDKRSTNSREKVAKLKSIARAQSFAKGGTSMSHRRKKKEPKKAPEHIKAQTKITVSAKDFGIRPEKTLKKKQPNKPKKTKGSNKFIVDGPNFLEKTEPQGRKKSKSSSSAKLSDGLPHDFKDSVSDFEKDETLYDDDHTLPFDAINDGEEEQKGDPETEKSEEIEDNEYVYKNRTPFSLGKPNLSTKKKTGARVPKLSRRLQIFEREILYKRHFDANAIEDDIVEESSHDVRSSSSNQSETTRKYAPKFRTITRTIKASTKETDTGLSSEGTASDVLGMMVIGRKSWPTESATIPTKILFPNATSFVTETNYITVTSTLPQQTTVTKTITEHNTSNSSSVAGNFSIPATVTSIKTRFRPTTYTETEYEDYQTVTITKYDDTLTTTIPKRTITRFEGTTTDTKTVDVISTFTTRKTKTVPNITITEYEESDRTVTSILTENITITETEFEGVSTKVLTTCSGTLSTTIAKKTISNDDKLMNVTATKTETKTEVKTKWYPEETVTLFKYYPTTTTASTTIATTTTTTTTLTSTIAGRARPRPNAVVSVTRRDLGHQEEEQDGVEIVVKANVTQPVTNLTNGTDKKSSMADQLKPGDFTSDGTKPGLNIFLIVSGAVTIAAIAFSLYTFSVIKSEDEDEQPHCRPEKRSLSGSSATRGRLILRHDTSSSKSVSEASESDDDE